MTSKPRNSLENFRVCYGYIKGFLTMFQDFATEILNVSLLCSNTQHPTKISQNAFVYWDFSLVECYRTPHQTLHQHSTKFHSID